MKRIKTLSLWLLFFYSFQSWAQNPQLVVPIGHISQVGAVAFSPDGKNILTAAGIAKLWDLAGHETLTFSIENAGITSLAFSPDGKQILTGCTDNAARLWSRSGQIVQTFKGQHTAGITSVAFSPDGRKILTGSEDNTARLWDVNGQIIQTFRGHGQPIRSVAFSPDGQKVLTGGVDKTAKLWNLAGNTIQTFTPSTGIAFPISSVAFSPDGQKVLTGSYGAAKLWDLSGAEIQTLKGHAGEVYVAFSPDGEKILTGTIGSVKLWNIAGRELWSKNGNVVYHAVTFSRDGKFILAGAGNDEPGAKLWDLSGRLVQNYTGHATELRSVAFSPDGKRLLTSDDKKVIRQWDILGRKIQAFTDPTKVVTAVALSPDGQRIITSNFNKTAKLWDLSGRQLLEFKGHTKDVLSVAFSPDGKQVVTGSDDKTAKLWDISGRLITTFTGHSRPVRSVAFSPDGKQVVTGSEDKTAKLWNTNGSLITTLTGHTSFLNDVAFSPDGRYVITGSSDNTAKLWAASGTLVQTFRGHAFGVTSIAFSPDSKYILTGSQDRTAKLWNLSGQVIQTFKGHSIDVNSVTFSLDGNKALTGSRDHTAKIWDTQTGKELATLIAIDSTDWVVTTPTGLFDASPRAMKLMYYVQNLEVIELDQLKERYYEPGLLIKILGLDRNELRNVVALDQVALYPEVEATIVKDQLNIVLTERNGGIGKLSLFLNGKEVKEDINPKRLKNLSINLNDFKRYFQTNNTIALRAFNADGWLKSQAYELSYFIQTQSSLIKPNLYALVVGTSNYAGEILDLRFADQDAKAISHAIQSTSSALFGTDHVTMRLLTSSGAESSSKVNIQKAFSDFASKAKAEDIVVVYFSGHGIAYGPAEKEQFYYLTKDISNQNLSDPAVRNNYTVSSEELAKWLNDIPALKQVMILDACNSGKVVEVLASIIQKSLDASQIRALELMKDRTGLFVLTGSASDKVSFEASQYGQGLLTYSLLKAMSGLALDKGNLVDVMTLFQYALNEVPNLAKGIGGVQTPVLAFPQGAGSFPIGLKNSSITIPIALPKPVFIRSNFQDENFGDGLKLAATINELFNQFTLKGAQAELIYADVTEYENGYSIRGNYTYEGTNVRVKGGVLKGGVPLGKFEVVGAKNDVKALAGEIIKKANEMLK